MRKFWSVPVITVYLYAVTILTKYGYYSYFGIPTRYIDASIKENIIYFFQLFQVGASIAGGFKWWMWAVVIVIGIIIFSFYISSGIMEKIILGVGVTIAFLFVWRSYNFGVFLAQNATNFYVPASICTTLDQNTTYVALDFVEDGAILIPIDQSTHRKLGGFMVRSMSDLKCTFEKEEVGKILQ